MKKKEFYYLADAQKNISKLKAGDGVTFSDGAGKMRTGSVRIKEVVCGKSGCKKCPHKIYAYARYRVGKKVTEKYIGVAR